MADLISFFSCYGLVTTAIAIGGIAILGCLKYFKLFNKFDEKKRHYIYLGISIGITVIGTVIYQVLADEFEGSSFIAMSSSVYALNQTFYNLFKITPVNKLGTSLLKNTLSVFGVRDEDFEEAQEDNEKEELDDFELPDNDER